MALVAEDLIVIEASGKLKRLHAVLGELGMRARCIATLGNLLESPPRLRPVAIHRDATGAYGESIRIPARPDAYERGRAEIRSVPGRLFIATDYDQEGHSIAADVVELAKAVRPDLVPMRLQLTELSPAALQASFAGAREYDPSLAVPGMARRIVDRVIASAYSLPSAGVLVGRATSAIAAMARRGLVPTHEATLQIPCKSGGAPFTARAVVCGERQLAELEEAAVRAAPLSVASSHQCSLGEGADYAKFLATMSEHMDLAGAAKLLQDLYEQGVVSYPRTASRHYGARGLARCKALARSHGARLQQSDDRVVLREGAHEALHIVDALATRKIDIARPAGLQGSEKAIALSWLSRSMIESVWQIRRDLPAVTEVPESLSGLDWARDQGQAPAWYRRPKAGARLLGPSAALLAGLQQQQIGRPSTLVGHVVRAQERHLVAPDGSEGPGASPVLARAPDGLQDPATAHRIDVACQSAAALGLDVAVDQALAIAAGRGDQLALLMQTLDEQMPDDDYSYAFSP
ncbi:DNA topoisomerase [Xanthomonas euvesicatoria]|uniref:DNA topoisomerase n=1 Tax=Xanthomonas euvesicatoria TaxID=456327 RepID=UPI0026E28CC2|nr:DNA topoisomerase [Xanthomonas euvesicatoria]MDO7931579.1 DNA topoisomerase [Xanthomonas euvesicatoria pv. eucalypti]